MKEMSRIGGSPISLPSEVTATVYGHAVEVSGPKGKLSLSVRPELRVELIDNNIVVKRRKEDKLSKSVHGLTRTLIANMVNGVNKGWEKKLELVGVGFRAQVADNKLILNVGYSHPVAITAPDDISFEVDENTKISILGVDKELVGQVAANIRKVRPPEPYKGKGIRYVGEYVRRKVGKAGKVGATTK